MWVTQSYQDRQVPSKRGACHRHTKTQKLCAQPSDGSVGLGATRRLQKLLTSRGRKHVCVCPWYPAWVVSTGIEKSRHPHHRAGFLEQTSCE